MGRVSRARRVATAAMYGGGGIGVLGAVAAGLIVSQVNHARRTIGLPKGDPPDSDGTYGKDQHGEALRLVVLGDSSSVGLGVSSYRQTPGAVVARNLARIAGRPVRLRTAGVVGALSADLDEQVDRALEHRPDLALIMIGGNDVTHRVWPSVAVRHLAHAVTRLREAGAEVVVGTCPDLGTIQPIRPPLRWVARRWSRELAAAQTIAVVEAGGRAVSLGDLLGPEFARYPDRLFSEDRFHPSAEGYAAAAAAMLPAFTLALQLTDEAPPTRSAGVSSLPRAAVTAAYHAGTEVHQAEVDGTERGPKGRWAELIQWARGEGPRSAELSQATAEDLATAEGRATGRAEDRAPAEDNAALAGITQDERETPERSRR
ncbi:MAG: SGNH/GDSL hydrolase family protein [Micromonosporaceae bacterium]